MTNAKVKTKIERWVTYFTPGALIAETTDKSIDHNDPNKVEWPEYAYAFRMFEREDIIKNGKVYKGETRQLGPTYYHPDSKIETLEQAKKNPKSTTVLIENMKCNNWDKIIWTRWGNWPQPVEKGDPVILSK